MDICAACKGVPDSLLQLLIPSWMHPSRLASKLDLQLSTCKGRLSCNLLIQYCRLPNSSNAAKNSWRNKSQPGKAKGGAGLTKSKLFERFAMRHRPAMSRWCSKESMERTKPKFSSPRSQKLQRSRDRLGEELPFPNSLLAQPWAGWINAVNSLQSACRHRVE